jgi:predicted NBD/HSP70 family sugar kinase
LYTHQHTPISETLVISHLLNFMLQQAQACYDVAQAQGLPVIGISVSAMGQIDVERGCFVQAPPAHSPLQDFPLRDALEARLSLPVRLNQTVHSMARCEARLGVGEKHSSFFYALVDEDVSGALWLDGQLWQGVRGNAGNIGYLVADWLGEKPITLAQRASSSGIIAQYTMRSRKFDKPTLADLFTYSQSDDQLAMRVLRDGGRTVGAILSPIVAVYEPQAVVVGGRLARDPLWWQSFMVAYRQSSAPNSAHIPLLPARTGDDAPLVGGGLSVFEA